MENEKRSLYGWILEIIILLCLLWSFYPLCFYKDITGPVPIHYNIQGQVDTWGKSSWLWFLPLLGLAMYIGLSLLGIYYSKLVVFARKIELNTDPLCHLFRRMLQYVKFFVVLMFAYINNVSLSIALNKNDKLNMYILVGMIVGLIGVIFLYAIKWAKLKTHANKTTIN